MARHTPAKFKPGSCQRLRHVDAQITLDPAAWRASLDAKLPFGAVKAMMEQQAMLDKIEHQYKVNGTCQICHTARSNTGACWC